MRFQFGLLISAIACVTVTKAINCNCQLPQDELRKILTNELNLFDPSRNVLFQSKQALINAPDSITITKNGPSGRFSKTISTAIRGNAQARPSILIDSPSEDSLIMKQQLFDNLESRHPQSSLISVDKLYRIQETPAVLASTLKENLLDVLYAAIAFQKMQQKKLLLNEASNFDVQKELVPIALALVEQLSSVKSAEKQLAVAGVNNYKNALLTEGQNPTVLNTINPQFIKFSRPAVSKAIAEAVYDKLISTPEQIVNYGFPVQRVEVAGNINAPSKDIASFEESIYDLLRSNANSNFQPAQLGEVILKQNGKVPAFVEKEAPNIYANMKSKTNQRMASQHANTIVNNVQRGPIA